MGLRFGDLTPEEFSAIVGGYLKREERDWYRAAWMTAYIMAPHLGKRKRLTPEKLLGWPKGGRRLNKKSTPPEDEE